MKTAALYGRRRQLKETLMAKRGDTLMLRFPAATSAVETINDDDIPPPRKHDRQKRARDKEHHIPERGDSRKHSL